MLGGGQSWKSLTGFERVGMWEDFEGWVEENEKGTTRRAGSFVQLE